VSSYKLFKLAAGSYDVALNGVIIAGLVLSETPSRVRTWTVELLLDLPSDERSAPFTDLEHHFGTLEEAQACLGNPAIKREG
jgi:hypothetical protein